MKNKKFLNLFRTFSIKLKKKIVYNFLILLILEALSSFSLPPFNFFLINFFTFSMFFIFLFKNLNVSSKKIYFLYGWLFGFGYFLTNINWIIISLTFDQDFSFLLPIALILIPAFLALFYGIVTFIFYVFNFKEHCELAFPVVEGGKVNVGALEVRDAMFAYCVIVVAVYHLVRSDLQIVSILLSRTWSQIQERTRNKLLHLLCVQF